MPTAEFTHADADQLLQDAFAPWVQELQLSIESISPERVVLRMKYSERLCREGGIICGQAFMALADTAMVFAVCAANGSYRPMTTVDMTTHMMRPIAQADVLADARVLRLGRTMAFGQVILRADGDERPAATATLAYALLNTA